MHFKLLMLSFVALSALAGCGSGGGGGGDLPVPVAGSAPPAPTGTADGGAAIPQSALSSSETLFAYAMSLIASDTNDTSLPVALDGAPFPVTDTDEPLLIT